VFYHTFIQAQAAWPGERKDFKPHEARVVLSKIQIFIFNLNKNRLKHINIVLNNFY
jgi:hypothetical protein